MTYDTPPESQPDASPSLTAIAQLKVALQEACMARDAYRAMIDYAEGKWGIAIRKKSWRQVVTRLHADTATSYPVSALCRLLGFSRQAYYQREEGVAMR